MSLNLFGVTATTIAARVHNLTINATSSPSAATVGEMINEAASELYREAINQGFDVSGLTSGDADPSPFYMCREIIVLRVTESVLTALDRGNADVAKSYRERSDQKMKRLVTAPQVLNPRTEGTNVLYNPADDTTTAEAFAGSLTGIVVNGGL